VVLATSDNRLLRPPDPRPSPSTPPSTFLPPPTPHLALNSLQSPPHSLYHLLPKLLQHFLGILHHPSQPNSHILFQLQSRPYPRHPPIISQPTTRLDPVLAQLDREIALRQREGEPQLPETGAFAEAVAEVARVAEAGVRYLDGGGAGDSFEVEGGEGVVVGAG
jgi:hypothetical protein